MADGTRHKAENRLPRFRVETTHKSLPDDLTLIDLFARCESTFRPTWLWLPPNGPGELCCGTTANIAGDRQLALTISHGDSVIAMSASCAASRFDQAGELIGRVIENSAADSSAEITAIGGFSFAPGGHMSAPWSYLPRTSFVIPTFRISVDTTSVDKTSVGNEISITHTAVDEHVAAAVPSRAQRDLERLRHLLAAPMQRRSDPETFRVEPATPGAQWRKAVARAIDSIDRGELDKIVLARAVHVDGDQRFVTANVLERLRRANPSSTTFALAMPGGTFVGATPELLLRRSGNHVESLPLAGTKATGSDTDLHSEKLLHEHALLADDVTATLAKHGSNVDADPIPREIEFGSVTHLGTRISAELSDHVSTLGVLADMHPTPAVGAAPRSATSRIDEFETFERGWYAGAIGRIGPRDAEFVLALRCGLIRDSTATIYAGCGIVEGSDPDTEYLESRIKLRPMLDALVTA